MTFEQRAAALTDFSEHGWLVLDSPEDVSIVTAALPSTVRYRIVQISATDKDRPATRSFFLMERVDG